MIVKLCVLLSALSLFSHAISQAQVTEDPVSYPVALPNAPQPQSTASISGTILDTNGAVLQGAAVNLFNSAGIRIRRLHSGADGQFAFSKLAPGTYQIIVTAPGMRKYTSRHIPLTPGQVLYLPPVKLAISVHAINVTVIGSEKQLSVQQVKIAEQQRIVGVIPNFYTTYNWNAPPMLAKQKFQLGFRSVLDPTSFVAVAGVAGVEQYLNVFPEFGQGVGGYARRYGTAYATHFASDILSQAVYPSIFHQDPRYFYKGKGSFGSRALYAISSTFITRGDNGHLEPNYSGILGNFSAAAISNLYYPEAERGGSLVLFNGLADTGADAGLNLIREFILKKLSSRATKGISGAPGD